MKHFTFFVFTLFCIVKIQAQSFYCDKTYDDIQFRIDSTFTEVLNNSTPELFTLIENEISNKDNKQYIYWKTYLSYKKALAYSVFTDNKNSELEINKAIEYLKKFKDKSSEHYALLGICQAFSIQFTKGIKTGIIAEDVIKNAEKAIILDNKNIRGYYLLGSTDFYTPVEFGGGKITEFNLLKAIEFPENNSGLACMPSWGQDEAYFLLIQFYKNKNNIDLAKRYANIAISKYPYNERIKLEYHSLAE